MAVGIYKPGQGYWVRVLSAVAGGALVLATAAWAWSQAVNIQLPAGAHRYEVQGAAASAFAPGQPVTLRSGGNVGGTDATDIGSGLVRSAETTEGGVRVLLEGVGMNPGLAPADARELASGEAQASVLAYGAEPIINPLYVQGGIVAVVLLVGIALLFYFIGSKPTAAEFLIATDGEMRKVNWSTFREVRGSTFVVIVACVLIAGLLFIVDQIFAAFFKAIGVLQG